LAAVRVGGRRSASPSGRETSFNPGLRPATLALPAARWETLQEHRARNTRLGRLVALKAARLSPVDAMRYE
jgi:hypothetical protein